MLMATEITWRDSTRPWLAAAVLAAAAMFAWLSWHAFDAVATLERLRQSHARAALVHDSILRLQGEVQRTVQLALATGDEVWLERHAEAESRLRSTIADLEATDSAEIEQLPAALAALDELSRIEARALQLLAQGRQGEGFSLVTDAGYIAGIAALGRAIRQFDDGYHDWLLSQSLGLTREEFFSLAIALLLFATAIAAWVILVRRLRREKTALLREIEARNIAEAGLQRAQKMELLGQLAGGVAHDVDNTLSAVAGYSSLARGSADKRARVRALDGLDRAVRQGRGLTSNLLSFVRHVRAARKPVELGALLRETQAWLAPLLPANIALEVRSSVEGELWLDADPASLQQALVNLALNARDAMPDGGKLTVSLCMPGEAGGTDMQPYSACIGISDTGCGMDAATLAQAREPLFSTKPQGIGTGLGLPSVERVVTAHGGKLEIESQPGAGTRVRMLLPAAFRAVAAAQRTIPAQVVSPDSYTGWLLADALEDAGLDVSSCSSFDAWSPDGAPPAVMLADWRQGAADAVVALRKLRDSGVTAPIIMLMDVEAAHADQRLEEAITGLAMVVSRSVPLGALGQLARRLAGAHEGLAA